MSGLRCSRQPVYMPTGQPTTCTSTAVQNQNRLATHVGMCPKYYTMYNVLTPTTTKKPCCA